MLGDKLRELRTQKHLTQQQIADKLDLTRPAYTAYETNRRVPDANTLMKLAKIYDVSADYLLGINQVPKWATQKDVFDLKDFLDGNKGMAYNGEGLTEEENEKMTVAMTQIFWDHKKQKHNNEK